VSGPGDELYRYRTGYLKLKSALCDRITGLVSYPLLLDEIRRFFEARSGVAVLAVELSALDRIEGIYGWQAVDDLLARAGGALRKHVLDTHGESALVAQDGIHLGRYVVFVPAAEGEDMTALEAARLAEDAGLALAAAFSGEEYAGLAETLAWRCGAAVLALHPLFRFERQVRAAIDRALPPAARRPVAEAGRAERDLRRLFRDGEIRFVFQPVVSLADRLVRGYEVLVSGPAGSVLAGPQSPAALAARWELSDELERLAQERALAAARALEPRSLIFLAARPALLASGAGADRHLATLLERSGSAPERLVIEIAEEALDRAGDPARAALIDLRRLGFRLALGRAGSGYATLQRIEDLRPDFVKIDPVLMRGLESHLLRQEVARSLVAVAARVHCQVIATGLTSEAEAEAARRCGIHLAQGDHPEAFRFDSGLVLPDHPLALGAPGP
jgi:EAL domain-containing protein (putative c-di-GMP-specific phosphodiesterase class I)